jgi:hypothetical protein
MIIKKKSFFKQRGIFILLTLFVIPLYSKAGDWLWKIDKQEYTFDEFSKDYKSYLQLMALQMGTPVPVLQEYIEKAENITDPRTQAMVEQLRPNKFGENFVTIMLLKKSAVENHYLERAETIHLEKFMSNFTIAQLYLNSIVEKVKIEIKDEDVEKEWLSEREKNENYKTIPIEQGLMFTRQKMTQEKRETLKQEFVKSLFERYKIEKNADYKKMLGEVKVKFD